MPVFDPALVASDTTQVLGLVEDSTTKFSLVERLAQTCFVETWTGTTGGAWSGIWADNTGAGTRTIQSNTGQLVSGASAFNPANALLRETLPNDVDITFDVTVTTAGAIQSTWFRCSAAMDSYAGYAVTGYLLTTDSASTFVGLYVRAGGTNTLLTSGNTSSAMSAGDVYHYRIRAVGSTLQAKVWKNAANEPGSWTLTTTDATYGSGRFALALENQGASADTHQIDNLSICPGAADVATVPVVPWRTIALVGAVASAITVFFAPPPGTPPATPSTYPSTVTSVAPVPPSPVQSITVTRGPQPQAAAATVYPSTVVTLSAPGQPPVATVTVTSAPRLPVPLPISILTFPPPAPSVQSITVTAGRPVQQAPAVPPVAVVTLPAPAARPQSVTITQGQQVSVPVTVAPRIFVTQLPSTPPPAPAGGATQVFRSPPPGIAPVVVSTAGGGAESYILSVGLVDAYVETVGSADSAALSVGSAESHVLSLGSAESYTLNLGGT